MIPFHRPLALSVDERENIFHGINTCLNTGQLTNGENVRELESKIKEMYQVEYVIATSNATMGLMLCLQYSDPNYYTQMTAFNWWSDLYINEFLNRYTLFIDIDRETWLPLERYHPINTIYLNTFGNIGESEYGEAIYDSTHALGAHIKDIGLAHIFSLAPTKLVTACEGGLIITNDKNLYEWALERRNRMCRMSEVHAIIGLATLEHLDEILAWKKKVYNYYKSNINGQFQVIPDNSNYNTIAFLNVNNLKIPEEVEYRRYYEPLKKGLINTDYVYSKIVALPSFHGVDYKHIVERIREVNGL